jgi:hypothetical protein
MRFFNTLRLVLPALALLMSGLRAEEAQAPAGTMQIGEKSYNLIHLAVYETKSNDEDVVVLLASNRKLPIEKVKAALREGTEDESREINQPHIRVVFNKSGKPEMCSARTDNSSFSTGGSSLTGEVTVEDGKARGTAALKMQGDEKFRRGFEIKFDVALLDRNAPEKKEKPVGPPPKPTVTGVFKGNGKPAKLAYISARPGEPFNDKPSIVLIFTEKDHSKEKRPDIKAGFGDFGSALIISVHEDGGIFGCEVAHASHEKKPFSSSGRIKMDDFEAGEDRVMGQITTDGEAEVFGQTWEVNLKFAAPYAAPPAKPVAEKKPAEKKPAEKKVAEKKPAKKKPADDDDDDDDDDGEPKADSPTDAVNIKDLPLPKDATNIEYKAIVEQFSFKSPAKVEALATDFTKRLGDKGWKKDGSDLVTPKTAILKRKRGDATLTIMLKPDGAGSQATIFTEGLNWEEK